MCRLSSPDSPFERGRTRSSRRRLTDYAINSPETPPPSNYGNHVGSEDSNSEHSYASYNSSPCQELPYQPAFPRSSPVGGYGPPAFPRAGFYQNPRFQSSPNFHRGHYHEEMVYAPHMDLARSYYTQKVPCSPNRYDYAVPQHIGQRPLPPPNPRLSPSPAKYDSPHYRPGGVSPQAVSEQLKSWHRRSQLKTPRSRSLDRQGAIRVKNPLGPEATYYQNQKYNEQVTSPPSFSISFSDLSPSLCWSCLAPVRALDTVSRLLSLRKSLQSASWVIVAFYKGGCLTRTIN